MMRMNGGSSATVDLADERRCKYAADSLNNYHTAEGKVAQAAWHNN